MYNANAIGLIIIIDEQGNQVTDFFDNLTPQDLKHMDSIQLKLPNGNLTNTPVNCKILEKHLSSYMPTIKVHRLFTPNN